MYFGFKQTKEEAGNLLEKFMREGDINELELEHWRYSNNYCFTSINSHIPTKGRK